MFRSVFAIDAQDDAPPSDSSLYWAMDLEAPQIAAALQAQGYVDVGAVAAQLAELRSGAFYARLSAQGQRRLDGVVPLLVAAALEHGNAATTLDRLLGVLRAIAGRSGYVQVLIDNPPALELLVRLCSAGRAIADFIARHPLVIDELLSGDTLRAPVPREALEAQARAALTQVDSADLEGQMNALRQFRHGVAMRAAVADVLGSLPVMKVSDQLSWLAEAVLAVASDCVWQPLVARHGLPQCVSDGISRRPTMAIVAYGKLGGIELGYASDLDLVFLHDSAGEQQQTDGERGGSQTGVVCGCLGRDLAHGCA